MVPGLDFGIPRYLLLELLQMLDRFVTGKERAAGSITAFVEMNFEEDEFADLVEALGTGDLAMQIAACKSTAARINETLRLDWMEE